jgi:hypothetical protein
MKTTNYKIINSDRLKGIESSVLKLLNEGWQPHGVIGRTEDGLFYQAMILQEYDNDVPIDTDWLDAIWQDIKTLEKRMNDIDNKE